MRDKNFDLVEFKVLKMAKNGMYTENEPYKTRVLELMDEGIMLYNPKKNWWKTGFKLSEIGLEYYKEFLEKVGERHGHVWKTHREVYPDGWADNDSYGDKIDYFAFECGHHNGPMCKKCGFSFCHHCLTEFEIEKCEEK